jgi:formylglycine-generating enzyme required for sulfatase activity
LGVIFKDEIGDLWFEQTVVRSYIAANFKEHGLKLEAERALKPGDTFRECAHDCPEMVVVPPGEFWMGSRDGEGLTSEHPRHKVRIDRLFAVGKFEVTWDDWQACVEMRGCDGRPTGDSSFGKGRRPVINVSWDQAKAFVAWLSRMTGKPYRLLSEAEWEYAARGVTSADAPHLAYSWGDKASHDYANYGTDQCCEGKIEGRDVWVYTAPVGQFPANAFGLHDMHGNVWEWVEDPWHDNYLGSPPTNGSVWTEGGNESRRIQTHDGLRVAAQESQISLGTMNEGSFCATAASIAAPCTPATSRCKAFGSSMPSRRSTQVLRLRKRPTGMSSFLSPGIRNAHRDGKFTKQPADQATHQQHRDEHGDQRNADPRCAAAAGLGPQRGAGHRHRGRPAFQAGAALAALDCRVRAGVPFAGVWRRRLAD